MKPLRLAIVGCGAIAELGHLPGAMQCPEVEITVLVDRNEARARALAAQFGITRVETDFSALSGLADAACVALPPHLHRRSAEALFDAGLHVLMEKPLATNLADADAMVAAAKAANRVLAVAMVRRFTRSSRYLKSMIEAGMLGRIKRYVASSGTADAWPAQSEYTFNVEQAGGGVLMSNGCHDLDMLLWLLGPIAELSFESDSAARMEGNCLLECRMESGAEAIIEVSRTRTLANSIRIEGELGVVDAPMMGEAVRILPRDAPADVISQADLPPLDFPASMAAQLADFAAACRGERTPLIDAVVGQQMLALVEQCYANAKPLVLPWDRPVRCLQAGVAL